jgi:heme/copper-type cytochrome/quinol oxidase subunit 4
MAEIAPIMWLMLGFFVLPMAAIIGTAFIDSRQYRSIHFGLTVLYTVLNFFHLLADAIVPPVAWYQIALMIILLIIGLLLNLVSFQWMKVQVNGKQVEQQVTF